jgi:hypothetical protein
MCVVLEFGLWWIVIKCFDWVEHSNNSGEEHEEEEDNMRPLLEA